MSDKSGAIGKTADLENWGCRVLIFQFFANKKLRCTPTVIIFFSSVRSSNLENPPFLPLSDRKASVIVPLNVNVANDRVKFSSGTSIIIRGSST